MLIRNKTVGAAVLAVLAMAVSASPAAAKVAEFASEKYLSLIHI